MAVGVGALSLVVLSALLVIIRIKTNPSPDLIVGSVPLDEPAAIPAVTDETAPHRYPAPPPSPRGGGIPRFTRPAARGLWPPDGNQPGPALPFSEPVDGSGGLQFVLILGSDARGGNPDRARTDSIHILALNPETRRGTVLGIPRDSWVNVPGHGKKKINEALNLGGPELAVRTVRELTGMPITYYVLTAFHGMRGIVDDLGGVDAYVPYDMNDDFSGAYFRAGWHRMNGEKALAFSRNRHVPAGDFARSENQGRLMLDVLKKLRAETSTVSQIETWLRILVRHARVDVSFEELMRLGKLARVTAASSVSNVVAPGRVGYAGRASVVFLDDQAFALFRDVAEDAVVNGSYPAFGPPQSNEQADSRYPNLSDHLSAW